MSFTYASIEETLLPTEMLERFRSRAPRYDAENKFFDEDLAELRSTGYLAALVPGRLGGADLGLRLGNLLQLQRRLASYAPATALGVNMHLVWLQVAHFLSERGDNRLDWVLQDAAAGEVFAFGISEAGNEAVLLDSFSQGEQQPDGGYVVNGTKIFTTLSPVWTRLGVHFRCGDELVFGFVRRDTVQGAITHPGTWNPLGMRATQSYTTRLEGVRVASGDVVTRIAPFDGSDPLILGIFSSFSLLTASVYAGIADRALELATEAARRVVPVLGGGEAPRLEDPDLASRLTEAVLDHRASLDSLEILARDLDDFRDRNDWFLALAACRNRVTDEARRTIDVAMRTVGAAGFQADSELARLYRDVLAGLFHPSSSRSLARTVRGSLASG